MFLAMVLLLFTSHSVNGIAITDSEETNVLENCVNKILSLYILPNEVSILTVNSYIRIEVPSINMFVETTSEIPVAKGKQKPDAYLMVLTSNADNLFFKLIQATLWNPKAKFLIIINDDSEDIFTNLNKFYLNKVVVLKYRRSERLVSLYDYKIVEDNRPVPIKIGNCTQTNLNTDYELFNNTNKKRTIRTLSVLAEVVPPYFITTSRGHNPNAIKTISEQLGIQPVYSRLNSNSSYQERIDALVTAMKTKKYDMFGGLLFLNDYEHFILDITYPAFEDKTVVACPALDARSPRDYIFSGTSYFMFAISIVIFYILFKFFKIPGERRYSLYLVLIEINLLECTSFKPKTNFVRLLLITNIIFVMIIHITYTSKRFQTITSTTKIDSINNIQDIMDLNMTIFIQQQIDTKNLLGPSFRAYINSHSIYCSEFGACLNKTANHKNIAMIGLHKAFEWYLPTHVIDINMVKILKSNLNSFTMGFYFFKGHPLFEEFNKRLFLLKQHGLIEYSYKKAKLDADRNYVTKDTKKEIIASSISHFSGIFVLYFIGNLIAVVVFCLEYFRII